MPKAKEKDNAIARNKRARHDYFIEEEYEAGIALEGWEVKSLREGQAQLQESYVILRQGEVFLFGAHFSPLKSVSTHVTADPTRTRKLLLHAKEIGRTYAPDNDTELYTLTDYRNRYALYRTDEGLLALHQNKPFIVVWDDHEITNDTYTHTFKIWN